MRPGGLSVPVIGMLVAGFVVFMTVESTAGPAQERARGVNQPSTAASAPGDAGRGKPLYYTHGCYSCHGYNGQTGARALAGSDSPNLATVAAFVAYLRLRADVAPTYPVTSMPNYAATALGDADARDIYAYIRTFTLDAPDVQDVPALRAILESAVGSGAR
jgi:mono/diheme cytochrome c family protein